MRPGPRTRTARPGSQPSPPGYHANKRHWNTVELDGSLDTDEVKKMLKHSYHLVVSKLPRADKAKLSTD